MTYFLSRSLLGLPILSLALFACQEKSDSSALKIVRGHPVAEDSPALHNVVALTSDQGKSNFCTGSIIAKDIIVTAAHCVDENQDSLQVLFGQPKSPKAVIPVASIQTYKPFGAALFPNFDIAWLKLSQPIPDGFRPLPLLRDASLLKKDTEIRLAGYGIEKTNCREDKCHDELLEANTQFQRYYDSPQLLSLVQFKGSAELGFGAACNGDSGGPAYAKLDGVWYLIGVTNGATAYTNPDSFEDRAQSCEKGSDLYTFMGDYLPWLEKGTGYTLPASAAAPSYQPLLQVGEGQAPSQPTTWAEWMEYPYHTNSAWYTVQSTLISGYGELRSRKKISQADAVRLFTEPEFSQKSLESLKELTVEFETLKGFENEDGLDLSPLASLQNLEKLGLEGFEKAQLASLSKLSQLKELAFRRSEATSLDLSSFVQLQDLRLESMRSLAELRLSDDISLQSLHIKGQKHSELSYIKWPQIKAIKRLEIGQGVIKPSTKLDFLRDKSIETLSLVDNALTPDQVPSSGLETVQSLNLMGNALNQASFLNSMPALQKADLRNNPIEGRDCPAGVKCFFDRFPKPQTLSEYCQNTLKDDTGARPQYAYSSTINALLSSIRIIFTEPQMEDCKALDTLIKTKEELTLRGDILSFFTEESMNLKPLETLPQLTKLSFYAVYATHGQSLGKLQNLKELTIETSELDTQSFIKELPRLTDLSYENYPYPTMEALSSESLSSIKLNNPDWASRMVPAKLEEIGQNTRLPNVSKLELYNQALKNLEGIRNLPKLKQLNISALDPKLLEPLKETVGLTLFVPGTMNWTDCPLVFGVCIDYSGARRGGSVGVDPSDAKTVPLNYSVRDSIIPGLGKSIKE